MSNCEYTNDMVALSSMRSALSYALECLSARKERESALMRRLSHYKSRVQTASC